MHMVLALLAAQTITSSEAESVLARHPDMPQSVHLTMSAPDYSDTRTLELLRVCTRHACYTVSQELLLPMGHGWWYVDLYHVHPSMDMLWLVFQEDAQSVLVRIDDRAYSWRIFYAPLRLAKALSKSRGTAIARWQSRPLCPMQSWHNCE